MSWSEFLTLTPHVLNLMVENYELKQKNELQKQNSLFHLQGLYFMDALLSTVGNMLSDKASRQYKYPKEPYPLNQASSKQLTDNEIQMEVDRFFAREQARRINFRRNKARQENQKSKNNSE